MSEAKVCSKCGGPKDGNHRGLCKACLRENVSSGKEKAATLEKRRNRVPLGDKNVLDYKGRDPNYEYRYFNDVPGRVDRAEMAGWEAVKGDADDCGDDRVEKSRVPGSIVNMAVGGGVNAILMRKLKDDFDEDYKKQVLDPANELEQTMFTKHENPNTYTKPEMKSGASTSYARPVTEE